MTDIGQDNFKNAGVNLLPDKNAGLYYIPDFLSATQADYYLGALKRDAQWEQKSIRIFGKSIPEPRLTAWYGDAEASYTYSGIKMEPLAWFDALNNLRMLAETNCHTVFNSALLNYYRNGDDSMGWHRDNEKELGTQPIIASVSLGESRTFQVRHHSNKKLKYELELAHGSLIVMSGTMQENWQHAVPKRKKIKGERINITFRKII